MFHVKQWFLGMYNVQWTMDNDGIACGDEMKRIQIVASATHSLYMIHFFSRMGITDCHGTSCLAMTGVVKRLLVPPFRGLSAKLTGGFDRFAYCIDRTTN